jgi:hypothetical protein
MADFCKQCSIENFGQDFGDLAGLGEGPIPEGTGFVAICEGCGIIMVDLDGNCISCDLKAGQPGHGPGSKVES